MPKQFLKLNDFRGGLNLIQDPRDIAMNELAQADNAGLRKAGRLMTGNQVRGDDGNTSDIPDIFTYPGGGIFPFETDREGSAAAKDTGERWVAALNSTTGEVSLKGSSTAEAVVVDMGTPSFFNFAADEFNFVSTSIIDRNNSENLEEKFKEGDVIRITGCTDVTANNRVVRVKQVISSKDLDFGAPTFTTEASEAGATVFTVLAKGIFFASDDTLRIADGAFNLGMKRKQYGYIKQIHFEDAGVAKDVYDNWYANDCDLSPPTALLIHGSSYPSAGTGFHLNVTHPATDSNVIGQFGAKTYQIAGSFIYRGNQESKLYIPTADNVFTTASGDYVDIDVNASPAYDERITGARVYIRPNGTNEPWSLMIDMDLKDGCRTGMDDEYKSWAVGSDATEAGVDTLILTSENLETYTILNGFNPDEFSISLSEFGESYKDSIIANRRVFVCNVQMVDENADSFTDATCDYNNDPTITMDSTDSIRIGMSVSGTGIPSGASVASVTNATTFELSASTTGGSVTNGTLTFGNIMKRMRDRIMYTPPNKYETFPRSFFIDVVKGDSDEYTALATYGDRLFAFKRKTLYVINIGSPSPANWFLESTERNKGVASTGGVFYSQDGIFWANRFGAFFFDGTNIKNLIKGKIPKKEWVVNAQDNSHPLVAFQEQTNTLYVGMADLSKTTAGMADFFVYNFDARGWARLVRDSDDFFFSNMFDDGEGEVIFNSMSTTALSADQRGIDSAAEGDSVSATKFIVKTKDFDFGDPARIKKVYGLRITYQSSSAQTAPIAYAINGSTSFSNFTGNFLDTSNAWDVLYAYTASPIECQSMQLKISNPTASARIDINDISIEYRTINKRVT